MPYNGIKRQEVASVVCGRDVFTTGQIAKLAGVAPRTATKWIDQGLLRGYRLPGMLDRRVRRAELVKFLKAHGLPLGDLDSPSVLVIGGDAGKQLAASLPDMRVREAADAFEAGQALTTEPAAAAVVDAMLGRPEALRLVRRLNGTCRLVGVLSEDDADGAEWLAAGCDAVVRRPFGAELAAAVKGACDGDV